VPVFKFLTLLLPFCCRIDKHRVADATGCGGLARFINHSCNPNCFTKVFYVSGVARMGIYAKRPIELGEELAYDYKVRDKTSCLGFLFSSLCQMAASVCAAQFLSWHCHACCGCLA
jgi:hypothetical protein